MSEPSSSFHLAWRCLHGGTEPCPVPDAPGLPVLQRPIQPLPTLVHPSPCKVSLSPGLGHSWLPDMTSFVPQEPCRVAFDSHF